MPLAVVVGLLFGGIARAEGISEFWPELNYFHRINPQARVLLTAAHAKGKESDERSADLAAYLDLSFKPSLLASCERTTGSAAARSGQGSVTFASSTSPTSRAAKLPRTAGCSRSTEGAPACGRVAGGARPRRLPLDRR